MKRSVRVTLAYGRALLLLIPWLAVAAGCALPVKPGCGPDGSLPGDDAFLTVATIAPDLSSSVFIDRTGRSYFSPDYTAWMLSTVAVCRTIPTEDVLALEKAWEGVIQDEGDPPSTTPERPYLLVVYNVDAERRVVFSVRPGEAEKRRGLENAVGRTLVVLERTYGRRFVRELRGAGLQDLLPPTPSSPPSPR